MVGIFPDSPRWLWALIFVAVNTVVNLLGISSIKRMNRIFLAIELIFVVIFVVIAVNALAGHTVPGAELTMNPIWDASKVTGPLIASALSIAVLSFLGFDGISTMERPRAAATPLAGP